MDDMSTALDRKPPLGKIEPYSSKYFLSCALGGIIGMLRGIIIIITIGDANDWLMVPCFFFLSVLNSLW